jgi:hypothetical protein
MVVLMLRYGRINRGLSVRTRIHSNDDGVLAVPAPRRKASQEAQSKQEVLQYIQNYKKRQSVNSKN